MTTLNGFFMCQLQVQAGVAKNFAYHINLCLSHTLVHITFSKNLVLYNPAYIYAEF